MSQDDQIIETEALPITPVVSTVEPEQAPKPRRKAVKRARVARGRAKPKRKVPLAHDAYGLRKGSLRARATMMYARPKGATLKEVKDKLGAVMFNVLIKLESKGHKIKRVKEVGKNGREITRFFLTPK